MKILCFKWTKVIHDLKFRKKNFFFILEPLNLKSESKQPGNSLILEKKKFNATYIREGKMILIV